jgi:hypothetical protein
VTICVGSGDDRNNTDDALSLIDSVDDSVGATPSAVTIAERRLQTLADSVRVVQQGSNDELVRREGDRLGKYLGKLPTCGRSNDQLIPALTCHPADRRRFMASAS